MKVDILIVGAGQSGLALAYYLKQTGSSFLLLDQEKRIGDSWRKRYDSLKLFTPRAYSVLPGLKLSGDQDMYPSKDEIADYLELYAKKFALQVSLQTKVKSVSQSKDGFTIIANNTTYYAKQVVIATGAFQEPYIPSIGLKLPKTISQLHSRQYKNPAQILNGSVLVVGAGNSGAQIAVELSKERKIFLSTGHKIYPVPPRIGPKSIFYLFDKLTLLNRIMLQPVHTKIGRRIYHGQSKVIIGNDLNNAIRRGRIEIRGRLQDFKDGEFLFQYNMSAKADTVIWATGFEHDFSWIKIPEVFDREGKPKHTRGVTAVPGLYFLGLPGLYTLGSAHLGWVKYDAEFISAVCKEFGA